MYILYKHSKSRVSNKVIDDKTADFKQLDWWPAAQCTAQKITTFAGARDADTQSIREDVKKSAGDIEQLLKRHGIDTKVFGQGAASSTTK